MSQRKLPDNFLDVQQGTPEWLIARVGNVTASRVWEVCAKLKSGKPTAARETYKMEVLSEIITGRAVDHYVTEAMQFGLDNEPLARTCYEMERGVEVEPVGYVMHPSIPRSGASPDGLVGDDGLIEIKVPKTATHLEYLLAEEVPEDYKPQMFWQMACTGRQWCDFVSYDPRLPSEFGLFIIRLHRNHEIIAEMETDVIQFIFEVNAMAEKLLKRKPQISENLPQVPRAQIPTWADQ